MICHLILKLGYCKLKHISYSQINLNPRKQDVFNLLFDQNISTQWAEKQPPLLYLTQLDERDEKATPRHRPILILI